MKPVPKSIAQFLASDRVAVAGVSRDSRQPANAILRRLRETGHEVVPINPNANELEGETCYPSLSDVPGEVDALMIATHPDAATAVVREASDRGIGKIWFHRSIGKGSVSQEAVDECKARGIEPIVGGCPMMYAGNVDLAHRCFRWWFSRKGLAPG